MEQVRPSLYLGKGMSIPPVVERILTSRSGAGKTESVSSLHPDMFISSDLSIGEIHNEIPGFNQSSGFKFKVQNKILVG